MTQTKGARSFGPGQKNVLPYFGPMRTKRTFDHSKRYFGPGVSFVVVSFNGCRNQDRVFWIHSPLAKLRLHDCFCKLVHMDQLACRSYLDTQIYKGSCIQITFTLLFLSFGPYGHRSVRVIWLHGPKSSHVSKFLSHGYFCKLVHTDKIIKIPVIKQFG